MSPAPFNIDSLVATAFERAKPSVEESQATHLATGLHALDERSGKIPLGEVVVITALKGLGCSALALSIARNVASGIGSESGPTGVLYLSLDQTAARIVERLLTFEAGGRLRFSGPEYMTQLDWTRLTSACNSLSSRPIRVEDRPFDSLDTLFACITDSVQSATPPVRLVVVDSLPTLARAIKVPFDLPSTTLALRLRDLGGSLGFVTLVTFPTRRERGWMLGPLSPFPDAADRVMVLDRPSYFEIPGTDEDRDELEVQVVRNRSYQEVRLHLRYRRDTREVLDMDP